MRAMARALMWTSRSSFSREVLITSNVRNGMRAASFAADC